MSKKELVIEVEHWAIDEKVFEATYKETEVGCRFCEHSDDLSGISDEKIDSEDRAYCYIGFNHDHVPSFLEYGAPGDGYDGQIGQADINYCPMCVRKLGSDCV